MDNKIKNANTVKAVRLQGFKKFKLKNTPILIKTNFSKSLQEKHTDKKLTKPIISATSTKFLFSDNESNNNSKQNSIEKHCDDKQISQQVTNDLAEEKNIFNLDAIFLTGNHKLQTEDKNEKAQLISENMLQSKMQPSSEVKVRSQKSSTLDKQSKNCIEAENTSYKKATKKCHLENATSSQTRNEKYSSHHYDSRETNKHHSKAKNQTKTPEKHHKYRSKSYGRSSKSPKSKKQNSQKQSTSSRSVKRKRSSSISQSSDDDEVMRKMREKRKSSQKSSETYTPRKKVQEIENISLLPKLFPDVARKNEAKNNVEKIKSSGGDERKVVKLKSAVALSSIDCWLDENEDQEEMEDDLNEATAVMSLNRTETSLYDDANQNDTSEKQISAQPNNFETVFSPTSSGENNKDQIIASNCHDRRTLHNENSFTSEQTSVGDSQSNKYNSSFDLNKQTTVSSKLTVDEGVSQCFNFANSLSNISNSMDIKLLKCNNKLDVIENNHYVEPITSTSNIMVSELVTTDSVSNQEKLPNKSISNQSYSEESSLFVKLRCDFNEPTKQTLPAVESHAISACNRESPNLNDNMLCNSKDSVYIQSPVDNIISTVLTIPKSSPFGASAEITKPIHPAKKRYHEWMKSMSIQENESNDLVKEEASFESSVLVNSNNETVLIPLPDVPESSSPCAESSNFTYTKIICPVQTTAEAPGDIFFNDNDGASELEIHSSSISVNTHFAFDTEATVSTSTLAVSYHQNNSTNVDDTTNLSLNVKNIPFDKMVEMAPGQNSSSIISQMNNSPLSSQQVKLMNIPITSELEVQVVESEISATCSGGTDLCFSEAAVCTSYNTITYESPTTTNKNTVCYSLQAPISHCGEASPILHYSISDDQSSISDLDALSPIDIRIPVDNIATEDFETNDSNVSDKVKPNLKDSLNFELVDCISTEKSSTKMDSSVIANLADEMQEEGHRRSNRIKTQKKKAVTNQINCINDYETEKSPPTSGVSSPKSEETTTEVGLNVPYKEMISDVSSSSNALTDVKNVPSFQMIEENIYLFQKKKSRARKEIRRLLCECISTNEEGKPPCGENCLNRSLMIECSARCPYGDLCTNKRFQRREYMPTEVFETSWKGLGLRATKDISPGKLVMEYCGEVLDPPEFFRRCILYAENNQQHFYFMALSQDEIIDATYKGNNSRFINHSCDPNCETQKWTVNGRLRVGFFSVRTLSTGEEITFDYQFERYGKEAQKCYCGSSNCRGYLGKPPNDNDVNMVVYNNRLDQPLFDSNSDNEKEKRPRNKLKRFQEFKENTLESEISRLNNGLQTTKEVLLLSRLMVRCDTIKERMMCLDVIRKSSNTASLRAFLHFHGLPLIWSWMVDVTGSAPASTSDSTTEIITLKSEILNTLAILPINNKNMLEDSKVLSLVKRWSEGIPGTKPEENGLNISKTDDGNITKKEIFSNDSSMIELDSSLPEVEIKEDESAESKLERRELENKVLTLSASLLNEWKDLKEIYKIPKRQKVQDDDIPANTELQTTSSPPLIPLLTNSNSINKSYNRSRDDRERSPKNRTTQFQRDKDGREKKHRRSPIKTRNKEEDLLKSKLHDNGNKYAWLEVPGSTRLSREEHRRQFEREMKNKDEKKNEIKQEVSKEENVLQSTKSEPTNSTTSMTSSTITNVSVSIVTSSARTVSNAATFTPSGYSGNLIEINPAPIVPSAPVQTQINYVTGQAAVQTSVFPPPYLSAVSQGQPISVIGAPTPPQVLSQFHPSLIAAHYPVIPPPVTPTLTIPQLTAPQLETNAISILGYHGINPIVMLTPALLKELTDLLTFKSLQLQQATVQPPLIPQPPLISQPPPKLQLPTQQVITSPVVQEQSSSVVVQQESSIIVSAPPSDTVTTPQQTVVESITTANETPSETSSNAATIKSPPKDPRPPRLPPNWKTASDSDGCVYYYHIITRQTQWDPPTWDASAEDMMGKKEGDMEISSPLQEETSKKTAEKLAATAIIASDTEQAKKAKESFRSKMSQHIVSCLSSYRKSDCKVGRITSNEDFKRIARKLTYNILMKEIKQVQVWEDLECNTNVKHKAKEYVRKYMAKMGPVYKSKDEDNSR